MRSTTVIPHSQLQGPITILKTIARMDREATEEEDGEPYATFARLYEPGKTSIERHYIK